MKENVHTMAKPNRSRNRTLAIRLSDSELYKFNTQFALAHPKGKAEYLMRLLEECPIQIIEDIVPLRADLKKVATNINQIAKALNASFYDDSNIDISLLSQVRKNSDELNIILEKIKETLNNAII